MKDIQSIYSQLCFVCICVLSLWGCSDDSNSDNEGPGGVTIQLFSPTVIAGGEQLTITGTHLDEVTEVVLPGDIRVNTIIPVGLNEIMITAPGGLTAGASGVITLKFPEGETASRLELKIAEPGITSCVPQQVKTGEILTIAGKDLSSVKQIIFPGKENDVTVRAIDFVRKNGDAIQVKIPAGTISGPGNLTLVLSSGSTIQTPSVTLEATAGGGAVSTLFEGEKGILTWAENLQLQAEGFANAQVGDILKITTSGVADGAQSSFKTMADGWPAIGPGFDYFTITGDFQLDITDEILVQLKATGLVIGGHDYVITGVYLHAK